MAFERDHQTTLRTGAQAGARAQAGPIDMGLRAYMLRVYNYMASGLALTGITAMAVAQSESLLQLIFGTPLSWVVMLAPLAFVMVLSFGINKMSAQTAQAVFWVFAVVMGVSMASIFMMYTGASIARVFFITAGTFAGMSLYGYTTKKDLTGLGSFLMMGLIGLIIASVVNIFLNSPMLYWVISIAGVGIFVGLTAYDTQKIKLMYTADDGHEAITKKAIMGALTLYLDFINLFIMLLRLFGDRR